MFTGLNYWVYLSYDVSSVFMFWTSLCYEADILMKG